MKIVYVPLDSGIVITHAAPINARQSASFPLLLESISAGFPSPAENFVDRSLDLNEYLVSHPAATFFVKVEGDSMIGAGINSGDILIVDRAQEAAHDKIIVAHVNGEFTIKRLKLVNDTIFLMPENPNYRPLQITQEMSFEVWGVVTFVIHDVR